MKRILMLIIVLISVTGCAKKQLSREEQLSIVERNQSAAVQVYENYSIDELANATEKVLLLMDPSDMRVFHQKNKVVGQRYYTAFLVFNAVHGFDTWVVQFKELEGEHIEVSVAAAAAENMGMFATLPTPRSSEEVSLEFSALCEAEGKLFFERLDYFLGKNSQWRTCEKTKEWAKENNFFVTPGFDGLPFMCGHNRFSGLEDKSPDYLAKN